MSGTKYIRRTGLKHRSKLHRFLHPSPSHHRNFGAVPLSSLPEEFMLVSTILNQGATEDCSAFSACAVRESMIGKQFDPLDFYDREGIENGKVSLDGYQLDVPMRTGVNQGFKALDGSEGYKANNYYSVDGPYDLFDSVRSAIYLNSINSDGEKTPVEGGVMWYNEWTSPSGMIPEDYSSELGLHAVKLAGWTSINGILYIVCQNSWGEIEGNGGLFYFPRDIFNRQFKEGLFYWSDHITPQQIRTDNVILDMLMWILQNIKTTLK